MKGWRKNILLHNGWKTCPYYQKAVQELKKKYGCGSVIKFDNETPEEFVESKNLLISMFPSMESFFLIIIQVH